MDDNAVRSLQCCSGGISTIYEEQSEASAKAITVIVLIEDIRAEIFAAFLQFLYTGTDDTV